MCIRDRNTTFSTIESFKHQGTPLVKYKLLVIDECSTVSNKDMVDVLQKANFEMLLLVGDTYQIDAIQFGNWFSVLKSFLPESAVFELTQPHRTKDERLLELWDKVRHMAVSYTHLDVYKRQLLLNFSWILYNFFHSAHIFLREHCKYRSNLI